MIEVQSLSIDMLVSSSVDPETGAGVHRIDTSVTNVFSHLIDGAMHPGKLAPGYFENLVAGHVFGNPSAYLLLANSEIEHRHESPLAGLAIAQEYNLKSYGSPFDLAFTYLDKVAVSEDHQGNGVGKKLVDAAIAEAAKENKPVVLRAHPEQGASDFYAKLGASEPGYAQEHGAMHTYHMFGAQRLFTTEFHAQLKVFEAAKPATIIRPSDAGYAAAGPAVKVAPAMR